MKQLFLAREYHDDFTGGLLSLPSGRELYTLERPWRNNRPFDSCIPESVYMCEPYDSPKFGDVYILSGGQVSKFRSQHHERYGILFHPANRSHSLAGCIAVGLGLSDDGFLRNSRQGCKLLFDELAGEPAMLFISSMIEDKEDE